MDPKARREVPVKTAYNVSAFEFGNCFFPSGFLPGALSLKRLHFSQLFIPQKHPRAVARGKEKGLSHSMNKL